MEGRAREGEGVKAAEGQDTQVSGDDMKGFTEGGGSGKHQGAFGEG